MNKQLRKVITVPMGIALAVSMVLGSGLFGLPGIAINMAGANLALISWIIISLLMIPMVIVFAELGIRYTTASGLAQYAEVAFGKWGKSGVIAVLCGTFTLGVPALALIGSSYFIQFFNLAEARFLYPVAILLLICSTIMNSLGVKLTSYVNTISLYLLLALILSFVALHPAFFKDGITALVQPSTWHIRLSVLWKTTALLFWAYLGWENMSFGLEEFSNPKKSIPKVYYLSFFIVVFIYLLLAATTTGAQLNGLKMDSVGSLTELIKSSPLFYPLAAVITLIIIANSNAWVFGASRLIFSAGKEHVLPLFLGNTDRNGIPQRSLMVLCLFYVAFLSVMAVFPVPLSTIILLVSQNFLVLYVVSIVAYWKSVAKTVYHSTIFGCSVVTCAFLLTGFTYWLLYPLALLALGYLRYQSIRRKC